MIVNYLNKQQTLGALSPLLVAPVDVVFGVVGEVEQEKTLILDTCTLHIGVLLVAGNKQPAGYDCLWATGIGVENK